MFEHKTEALLPRRAFLLRMVRSVAVSFAFLGFSLLMGSAGYHFLAGLTWVDALLNASMILTGMGPIDPMPTTTAKLFAAAYALCSGVAFLTTMAVLLAPLVHRFMHRFHLEQEGEAETQDGPTAPNP